MFSLPMEMNNKSTPPSDTPTLTLSQLVEIDETVRSDVASDTSSELSSLSGSCPPTPESFKEEYRDHPRYLKTSKWLNSDDQTSWRYGEWEDENQQPGVTPSSPVTQSIEYHGPPVPKFGRPEFTWYTPPVRARRFFRYPPSRRFVPVTRRGPGNHGTRTYIMFDRQTNTLCHGKTWVDHPTQNLYEGAWWAEWEHPHIVKHAGWQGNFHPEYIYDHPGANDPQMHMTELCEGGPLTEEIRRTLSGKQVLEIIRQTASALRCLHEAKVMHTDIKPSKILIRSLNPVNIALDLSTSTHIRLGHWEGQGTPSRLGTPGFQSRLTEQLGEAYTFADDLWSLGRLIQWLITKPFQVLGKWHWQAQHGYTSDLRTLNPEDRLVRELMYKLINTRPYERCLQQPKAEQVERMVSDMLRDGVYGDERIVLNDDVESVPLNGQIRFYRVIEE